MRHSVPAILAVLAFWGTTPPADATPLERPMYVEFRLRDGDALRGKATDWDERGLEGDFGRREWTDLIPADVFSLRRRFIDRTDVSSWIDLGEMLLAIDGGAEHAEKAFAYAKHLDASCGPAVEAARGRAAFRLTQAAEAAAAADAARLRTGTPEAGPWPSTPWPIATADEQATATLEARDAAAAMLRDVNVAVPLIPSRHFLLYTDLDATEALKWALQLDKAYGRLVELLNLPPDRMQFAGNPVVFVLSDWDAYSLLEATHFHQLVAPRDTGITHYDDARIVVNVHRDADRTNLPPELLRQITLACLHRLYAPTRLPAWANEGLATWIAEDVDVNSLVEVDDRVRAIRFIRAGGDVAAALATPYDDPKWRDKRDHVSALGYLLVDLMIRERPDRFARWVAAVKTGTDWREALKTAYGATADELLSVFVQYYRVND